MGTCSVREILESLPEDERVAYTTVQTLVYRFEEKGAGARMRATPHLVRKAAAGRAPGGNIGIAANGAGGSRKASGAVIRSARATR